MNVLHRELFATAVVLLSLVDNSLLVYTADNTLYHYLVVPTSDSIKLHLCGSISFDGVVAVPGLVRGMSWMIPAGQKRKHHLSCWIVPAHIHPSRTWRPYRRYGCCDDPPPSGRQISPSEAKKGQ